MNDINDIYKFLQWCLTIWHHGKIQLKSMRFASLGQRQFFSAESLPVDKSHTTGSIAQFAVLGSIFYALDSV